MGLPAPSCPGQAVLPLPRPCHLTRSVCPAPQPTVPNSLRSGEGSHSHLPVPMQVLLGKECDTPEGQSLWFVPLPHVSTGTVFGP